MVVRQQTLCILRGTLRFDLQYLVELVLTWEVRRSTYLVVEAPSKVTRKFGFPPTSPLLLGRPSLEVGLFTYAREMTAAIYTDDIRHPCAYHILLKIHPFFPKNDSERGDSLWNCVSTISSSPYLVLLLQDTLSVVLPR